MSYLQHHKPLAIKIPKHLSNTSISSNDQPHYQHSKHINQNINHVNYGAALKKIENSFQSIEFEEYGDEISSYMNDLEDKMQPLKNYMGIVQAEGQIDWKMRKTLVVWLVEVHKEYNLRLETLYLTINILDRYCSLAQVDRPTYQLLGITSLLLAAKYEENHGYVPSLKNLSYMCCDAYTDKQFRIFERRILNVVGFEMGFISPETFTKRFLYLNPFLFTNPETRALIRFFNELSLVTHNFLNFKPSVISLASMLLAHQITEGSGWVVEEDVEICRVALIQVIPEVPNAIYQKYNQVELCNVSSLAKNWSNQQRKMYVSRLYASGQLTPPKDNAGFTFPNSYNAGSDTTY
ncbi:G2/mitotic-specific cyclin [Clydaea vesicula]|uniref:G2/mitotic-specific cyclin n=1 Tax=Clydaea vesicula TaxID=447962 RepID=A0AAD5TUX8_9FUNG|nr:G2/mitotic-specific cyclin [Clydaea vesicula]KAJ3395336.1 G2/mitotic-specific cyclin [Lobulomyces angularis]